MCKKQTSVSHRSTEGELKSLKAVLRMDGIPALDLWDLVLEVFHSSQIQSKKNKGQTRGNMLCDTTSNKRTQNQTTSQTKNNNIELSNVDCVLAEAIFFCAMLLTFIGHVPSSVTHSGSNAMFYVLEEAVIKIIIKGRSRTMRHASITHRVTPDRLFDIINLDPLTQIQYIGVKHQLADIFWPKVIFFICSTSAISAPLAALGIPAW